MKYLHILLVIFPLLLHSQSNFIMNNKRIYYEDTIDNLSGVISYCTNGHYTNDVTGSMMGISFHQYQNGVWSYDNIKDELKQTMYLAKDINSGKIIENYTHNPALSTTITKNIKATLHAGSVNGTTRIIKVETIKKLNCP